MGISQVLLVTSVPAAGCMQIFTLVVKQCCLGSLINLFTAADPQVAPSDACAYCKMQTGALVKKFILYISIPESFAYKPVTRI